MKNKNSNVIPRKFNRLVFRQLSDGMAGNAGDVWHVFKNDFGYLGLNTKTGKYWRMFVGHLRIKELWELVEVA